MYMMLGTCNPLAVIAALFGALSAFSMAAFRNRIWRILGGLPGYRRGTTGGDAAWMLWIPLYTIAGIGSLVVSLVFLGECFGA